MKSLKSFLLLAASVMFAFGVSFAQTNKTNPDNAQYYIKGDLSIEGDSYKLSNITSQGITFEDPGPYIIGTETEKEDVRFVFSRYGTDYPGGKDTKLQFWRYLYGEWVPDGETRQGSREMSEKKSMVVMLVLDCSSSMSSDINSIKQAAKNLVNTLYSTSSDGKGNSNIKIGYVTFSTVGNTYVSEIKPLTSSTKSQIESAINSISTNNGTALYYAMDKAVEKIEAYCSTANFSNEPLSSVTMLTFTDGLDQGSIDKNKGIRDGQSYYNYFINKYKGKQIGGLPLCSNIIGVRGNDIISDNQWNNFMSIGRSLSEEINSCGSFKTCDISQLAKEFQIFAENLVNQWKVLNLYVPNAFQGPVAWTFYTREDIPKETPARTKESPKETKTKKTFVGLSFGGGFTMSRYHCYDNYYYTSRWVDEDFYLPRGGIGLDVAFPVGTGANLGFYMYGGFPDVEFGPTLLVNFKKIPSLYLGSAANFNYMEGCMGWGFRIGFATKKHFYMFCDVAPLGWDLYASYHTIETYQEHIDAYTIYEHNYDVYHEFQNNVAVSLHFGVHF